MMHRYLLDITKINEKVFEVDLRKVNIDPPLMSVKAYSLNSALTRVKYRILEEECGIGKSPK